MLPSFALLDWKFTNAYPCCANA